MVCRLALLPILLFAAPVCAEEVEAKRPVSAIALASATIVRGEVVAADTRSGHAPRADRQVTRAPNGGARVDYY